MMIFFNDPVEVPNPAERAIRMAVAMRAVVGDLAARWRQARLGSGARRGYRPGLRHHRGHRLRGPLDYGAIGTVTNLAARLCGEAPPGRSSGSLVRPGWPEPWRAWSTADDLGPVTLKGLARPVPIWSVRDLR
jgi:class 3 adenylate cyclase